MVFINPVFSRKGVPFMVRTGLVLALSMLIAPAARSGAAGMISFSTFDMAEALIREGGPGGRDRVHIPDLLLYALCGRGPFGTRHSAWPWERSWIP